MLSLLSMLDLALAFDLLTVLPVRAQSIPVHPCDVSEYPCASLCCTCAYPEYPEQAIGEYLCGVQYAVT